MKIIYDGQVLINILHNTSGRSGIFWVAFNLVKRISNLKDIELYLYFDNVSDYSTYNYNLDFFNKTFSTKIKCINDSFYTPHEKSIFEKINYKHLKYLQLRDNAKNALTKGIFNFLKSFYKKKLKKINKEYYTYIKKYSLQGFDVFISPFHAFPKILENNPKIKKAIVLYDTIPINFPQYYKNFNINDNSEYAQMLRSLDKNTSCFCISECTKNDFLKHCSDRLDENKMYIMPIATAQKFYPDKDEKKLKEVLDKHNISQDQRKKYIFSLCTLEPRKNLIFTIKCFIEFIKENNIDDLYFYIGGGHWKDFIQILEKEIQDLDKYKNKIVKLGYIDDEDVNILYSNSLFFVYITLYEGFGMPPLEAMSCGTPVLTSNTSSIPEIVEDAAITIDPNDKKSCIKAMNDLYYNEELRKELCKKGLEQSKKFNWNETVKIIIDNLGDKDEQNFV